MALTVLFAVLAAFCNALGSVLQRKGTRSQPFEEAMSVRLLWRLVHQLPWLGGIVFMLGGFGLQVAALSTGPISLVQPVLVAEMGLTLVLSAMLLGSSMHTREWTAVFGMNTGIALLLVALRPTGGDTRGVTGPTWALGCLVTLAVIVGTVVLAHRYRYAHRAAYLGIAAGMFFGFIAVLVSGVTGAFAGGPKAVLSAWQTYALIVAGPTGFFLLQVTLRAGTLVASQPGLTLANPLVGIGWGVAVFGEDVRGGGRGPGLFPHRGVHPPAGAVRVTARFRGRLRGDRGQGRRRGRGQHRGIRVLGGGRGRRGHGGRVRCRHRREFGP